ncbi:hypothetical protein SteCoe_25567 [Stentor coeruleus]|uniref:Major facilitator superfamily associated domain-containing protein n=1 Tax=Stentor coeruleus TaxID=5963 RepID=A0A1R2BF27_9CILI|nr:hypothetical protein SteCoe_25567 [Stentor coeruleus]
MFITKRKYRLPRKHMMTFSLVCSTLCMILLSVKNLGSYKGEIAIEVLSKIFIGLGWASAVYVNITLLSSLYEEHFQVLFATLKAFGLAGIILGYIAIRYSSSLKGAYIAFAVISAVMIPFAITLTGDMSYILSAERYTLLDYIKKPKQLNNVLFLTYIFFSRSVLLYYMEDNLQDKVDNEGLLFFCTILDILGGFLGLFISCFINFKLAKTGPFAIACLIYGFTFFIIGPWDLVFPRYLWLSLVGLVINGMLVWIIIVNLVMYIYHNSIHLYSFTAEDLLSECIGAMFVLCISIGSLFGPIFSIIFDQFSKADITLAVIGFLTFAATILHSSFNISKLGSVHIVETAPNEVDNANLKEKYEISEVIENPQSPNKDIETPLSESPIGLVSFKKDSCENYDYNYLNIQAGYCLGEDFYSIQFEKARKALSLSLHLNNSVPLNSIGDIASAIEEQKIEESVSSVPEEDVQSDSEKKVKILPPVFKEIKVDYEPSAEPEEEVKRNPTESSYHMSKDAIKDLSGLFPDNSD